MLVMIGFELRSMFRRRLRNPVSLTLEGVGLGLFMLVLEKLLSNMGITSVAERQVMFISSVLALPAIQGFHRMISEEFATGTAETLFQVKSGPILAMLAKDVGSIASLLLILPFTLLVMRYSKHFDPSFAVSYILPIFFMRTGLLGLGMLLGSLTILFRRTSAVVNLTSIVMMVTSLGASSGEGVLAWIAAATPHGLLAMMLQEGKGPSDMLIGLALVSTIWITAGLLSYNFSVKRARRFGFLLNN